MKLKNKNMTHSIVNCNSIIYDPVLIIKMHQQKSKESFEEFLSNTGIE